MNSLVIERLEFNKKNQIDAAMIICLVAAVALRIFGESTAVFSYFLVAGYSLFGRVAAIQALTISWFLTVLNPGIAPDSNGLTAGRFLVVFFAAFSVAIREILSRPKGIKKFNFATLMLGLIIIFHSFFFSFEMDVSILKISAWLMVILTLLSAWQNIDDESREILFNQIENFLALITIFSLPLLAVPGVGYLRNDVGFQGLLNHPQAFGPTVALLGALVSGKILSNKTTKWKDVVLFGICLVMVVLSGARTAGFAMLIGLTLTIIFGPILVRKTRMSFMPGLKSKKFWTFLVISFFIIFVTSSFFVEQVSTYVFKRAEGSSLIDAAEASRGGLVLEMFSNIEARPLVGIGFGIASRPSEMEIIRDGFLGLPLSTAVEKGVMPIAVVEELGMICAVAVFLWLLLVLKKCSAMGVQKLVLIMTLLLINLGESMLFSVGGMGMILLILMTGSIAK